MVRSLMLAVVLLLVGCDLLGADPSGPCLPVDVGGECFEPSEEALIDHALTSAGAWRQLDGLELTADRVIEGIDLTNDTRVWVIPLVAEGEMVAVSRFVPVAGDQVKLGEVALLEEPLPPLPDVFGGEFVLYVDSPRCIDNPALGCLFSELAWAVRLDDGRFRTPDGEILEMVG